MGNEKINNMSIEKIFNELSSNFTAHEVEAGITNGCMPYLKAYMVESMEGLRELYDISQAQVTTDRTFQDFCSSDDKYYFVIQSYLNTNSASKSADLYFQIIEPDPDPNSSNPKDIVRFTKDIEIPKEWQEKFVDRLVEHIGKPQDEYAAEKIIKQFRQADIEKIQSEDKKNNTTTRRPELKDYLFKPEGIIDAKMVNDGKSDAIEFTLRVSYSDIPKIMRRTGAEQFLTFCGTLNQFKNAGYPLKVIATYHADESITFKVDNNKYFAQPLVLPGLSSEKHEAKMLIKQFSEKLEKESTDVQLGTGMPTTAAHRDESANKSAGMPTTAAAAYTDGSGNKSAGMPTTAASYSTDSDNMSAGIPTTAANSIQNNANANKTAGSPVKRNPDFGR